MVDLAKWQHELDPIYVHVFIVNITSHSSDQALVLDTTRRSTSLLLYLYSKLKSVKSHNIVKYLFWTVT